MQSVDTESPAKGKDKAKRPTKSTSKMDNIKRRRGCQGAVVAVIVSIEEHPSLAGSDVVTISTGSHTEHQVVVRTELLNPKHSMSMQLGAKVAFAPAGSEIVDDLGMDTTKVSIKTVKGVKNEGVLCSAKLLGLPHDRILGGPEHDSLLVLSASSVAGTDVGENYLMSFKPEVLQTAPP